MRRAVRILTAAALGAAVLGALGCGHRHPPAPSSPTARALKVESEDLLAVYRALGRAAPSTQREIQAAKTVWPLIYAGLPRRQSASIRAAVEHALRLTQQIYRPPLFEEEKAATLTGPSSELAGLFHGFTVLAERSWTQILASIRQEEGGPSQARAFARSIQEDREVSPSGADGRAAFVVSLAAGQALRDGGTVTIDRAGA